MMKYIFGAIFIALAWALVIVFHERVPMWPAIVVTAVIAGGILLYVIIRMLLAKRAAAAIEQGLADQALRAKEGMRPDLEAQIQAMQAEFTKAVNALKGSKLGRSGRDTLGLLPWYVIIGPPGSGKTTAIQTSGLKFPLGRNSSVRGVGGTRNCAWWMTNDAIILDTAGRWSVEDDDRDEWLAFLDLLKKTRPQKPINGIMLAVSTTEMQGTEEELADLARALRERVDELISRLDVVLPVYLLITKCDLLAGFVETFGDLKDRERGQIWGFTLPVISEHADHVEAMAQHFDDLGEVLERKAFLRMGEERRVEARERIRAFPQQFDSLRQGLIDLVANLFDQNVYRDGPIMRGVYFSSGTQEGRPVDRVMAHMAEAFGVRPRIEVAPPTKPKSYFVRDLFQRIVFPDQNIAVESERALKKKRLVRWGIAAAALAVSAALLILPVSSYLENERFVTDGRTFVDKLARARQDGTKEAPLGAAALESAEPMATRLAGFASKGPDVSLRFGLYPGERLMTPLRTAVERLSLRPILDADADRLMELSRGRAANASQLTGGLALQLLVSQPKASDEPAPENDHWRDKWMPVAIHQVGERWTALVGETVATARARRTLENAVTFWLLGAQASADLLERKASVISRVRTALTDTDEGDPLSVLLQDPSLPRDLRLVDVVGGAVTVLQNGDDKKATASVVSGAFTPAGWKVVKERIAKLTEDHEHDENAWVLGTARKRQVADAATLKAGYFRRYIDAWKSFLLSLNLKEPVNIDEARSMVKLLLTEKPLDSIWRNVGKEVQFKDQSLLGGALDKAKAQAGAAANAAENALGQGDDADDGLRRTKTRNGEPTKPEDVGNEFAALLAFGNTKPTGLDAYGEILAAVQGALGEQGTPDPKAFPQVMSAQRVKLAKLIASYNENGWEGQLLGKILEPPLRGAEVAVEGATGDSVNRRWCDSIVVVFDQTLASKYPFAGGKPNKEARVADVDKFFMPKTGALWQYYTEALAGDVEHPAGTTVFHFKDQTSVKYKPTILTFLTHAQQLTDLLYAKDPTKSGVAGAIRLHPSAPYTKIIFESGGHKVTYFNTKERWDDLIWPSHGALLRLYQKTGESDELGYPDGEWALFHLLESGKATTGSEGGEDFVSATWATPLRDATVHADFKPGGLLKAFRAIDVPRSVVGGGGGCAK
jgi:type VI secretion system protein ImpL